MLISMREENKRDRRVPLVGRRLQFFVAEKRKCEQRTQRGEGEKPREHIGEAPCRLSRPLHTWNLSQRAHCYLPTSPPTALHLPHLTPTTHWLSCHCSDVHWWMGAEGLRKHCRPVDAPLKSSSLKWTDGPSSMTSERGVGQTNTPLEQHFPTSDGNVLERAVQ